MPPRLPPIDIIVPIFNARNDVMRCVKSVLEHASGDYRLLLVNDCSTDQELVEFLTHCAKTEPKVELINAEKNGGFVQTANLGLRRSLDDGGKKARRDVLLLNSDTIATPEFLARIQACAYADDRTGIVCPFSNNATILSLPEFCKDNPLPAHLPLDDYARIISACSMKRRPEIVTGVGFCMFIRGEVLETIGILNPIYGRGFGEENEFCEVAKNAGYTIRLADDVFVAHTGKASFGAEGSALERQNMKLLLSRFPHYMEEVAYFCETNPLLEVQSRANYFTARATRSEFPALLHLVHSDPFSIGAGGSEHYVFDLLRGMKLPRALVVYPSEAGITAAEVLDGDVAHPLKHYFPLENPVPKVCYTDEPASALIRKLIAAFKVGAAHIHHLFFWPVEIWKVFSELKVPYVYTAHDYYAVHFSHNFFDYSKMSMCDCPATEQAVKDCLNAYAAASHTQLPGTDSEALSKHRRVFGELLRHAEAVIAPSEKTLSLLKERCGVDIKGEVVPHGYDLPAEEFPPALSAYGPLKIGVLGNVNYPAKGAQNYREAVRLTRHAAVEWHFFGDVRGFGYQEDLKTVGDPEKLKFHGAYKREEIFQLLRENGIQLVVLLPACHETFSFTLSEALLARIPVLALRCGSLEERLVAAGFSDCLCVSPSQAVERILYYAACRTELVRLTERTFLFSHPTSKECADRIFHLYGEAGARLVAAREDGPLNQQILEQRIRESEPLFQSHLRALRPSEKEPVPVFAVDRYRPVWWRPVAKSLGAWVRGADEFMKDQYLRNRIRAVQSFPFRTFARMCSLSADTQFVKEQSNIASFRALGRDPFLILPQSRIRTSSVDCLRLRIRCETTRRTRAQLFWTHQEDEGFSEQKSCHIPLSRTNDWQDVVLDFRNWSARSRWTSGPEVVSLRLDPLDCEGYFELQELTFAKFQS